MLVPNKINWHHDNFNKLFEDKTIEELYHVDHGYFKDNIKNFKLDDFKNRSSTIVIIKNNLDWLESMAANVNLRSKLIELGYKPEQFKMQFVFQKWYSDLFKLNQSIEKKYENFLQKAKPNKDTVLICAQVRLGGPPHDSVVFTHKNNTVIYWNYIRNKFIQNNTNFMIFLTTDSKQVEDEARSEFGFRKLIINDGFNAHLDRESNLNNNCSKVEKTFLDFHSLQNCDKAIISESGYGKLNSLSFLNYLYVIVTNSFIRQTRSLEQKKS